MWSTLKLELGYKREGANESFRNFLPASHELNEDILKNFFE